MTTQTRYLLRSSRLLRVLLALCAFKVRAELFEAVISPGHSAPYTVCSPWGVMQPNAYDSSFLEAPPTSIHFTNDRIYVQEFSRYGIRSWSGCADYELTVDANAAPGRYEIIVQYSFFWDPLGTVRAGGITSTNIVTVPSQGPSTPPGIITNDGNFGFRTNIFGFNIAGSAGQGVVIEASTNLVTWTALSTNTLGSILIYYSDPNSATMSRRFYRARNQ